jgi:uncharacterized protein involved in exopolysaccharide biosynthesis
MTLVKARAGLIALLAVLAAGGVFLISLSQPDRYKATAALLFGGTPSAEILVEGGTPEGNSPPERTSATNIALASMDSVAERVKRRLGTPAGVDELKDAMHIAARGDSDLVDLTAEWEHPERRRAAGHDVRRGVRRTAPGHGPSRDPTRDRRAQREHQDRRAR